MNWLCCCAEPEDILVFCHWPCVFDDADSHTGTISRVNRTDGTITWSTDLGTDSVHGFTKRAIAAKIDSDGSIYVLYDAPDPDLGGAGQATKNGFATNPMDWTQGTIAGGVAKLNSSGVVQWDTEFPEKSSNFADGVSVVFIPRMLPDLDLTDTHIWAGHYLDSNEKYVTQILKSDGSIVKSLGFSDLTQPSWDDPTDRPIVDFRFEANLFSQVRVSGSGDLFLRCVDRRSGSPTGLQWFLTDTSGNISWIQYPPASATYPNIHRPRAELFPTGDGDEFWLLHPVDTQLGPQPYAEFVTKATPNGNRQITVVTGAVTLSGWDEVVPGVWQPPAQLTECVVLSQIGTYVGQGMGGGVSSFLGCISGNGRPIWMRSNLGFTIEYTGLGPDPNDFSDYVFWFSDANQVDQNSFQHTDANNVTDGAPQRIHQCRGVGGFYMAGYRTTADNYEWIFSRWSTISFEDVSWYVPDSTPIDFPPVFGHQAYYSDYRSVG